MLELMLTVVFSAPPIEPSPHNSVHLYQGHRLLSLQTVRIRAGTFQSERACLPIFNGRRKDIKLVRQLLFLGQQ